MLSARGCVFGSSLHAHHHLLCIDQGDTAQTIARGVGFRFTDIKDIFHSLGRTVPETYTLIHNYRSHRGV